MNRGKLRGNTNQTDPYRMDLTARIAFKKVYPFIAQYIVDKYGIVEGWCLDLGSGPGSLSIAIAKITALKIIALDVSPGMADMALANTADELLPRRISPVTADVHEMPFQDNSIDLIISRGSLFFWDCRPQAFKEIYRILKPGGAAFCGGGMGSEEIRREADAVIMTNPLFQDFREFWQQRNRGQGIDVAVQFNNELEQAGISGSIDRGCQGVWVEIKKSCQRQG